MYLRFGVLLLFIISFAQTQTVKVGVVLPLTGSDASLGQAYKRALDTFQQVFTTEKPYLLNALEIVLRDSGSSLDGSQSEVEGLINEGVQAIVCCTAAEEAEQVLPLAASYGIPLFALSPLSPLSSWGYSLEVSDEDIIRAIFLAMAERGQTKLAVMTEESQKAALEQILRRLSVPGGVEVIDLTTYPFEVDVLTPEALWVATRQPSAVLIWDGVYRARLAYVGLRQRGYEQNVFVPPKLFQEPWIGDFSGAFSLVSPLQSQTLSKDDPAYQEVMSYQNAYLKASPDGMFSAEGAELYDALNALVLALEQVLSYGIQDEDALRSALLDSLGQLREVQGITGKFDFSKTGNNLLPNSWVIARASGTP